MCYFSDGKEILRLYEYRFSDDRFYVDEEKGEVTWLYFNPDSTSGGQFVENVVTLEQIIALKENEDYTVFFDKLGSEARQTLVDVGDEDFRDVAKRFLLDEYYYHGFGTEAREEIISRSLSYKCPPVCRDDGVSCRNGFIAEYIYNNPGKWSEDRFFKDD